MFIKWKFFKNKSNFTSFFQSMHTMKQLLTIAFILLISQTINAQSEIFFDQTVQHATSQNKPILLVFSGSDWCKNCIDLDEKIFKHEKKLQLLEEKFVLHFADFPRANLLSKNKVLDNEMLADQYNPNGFFPYILSLKNQQTEIKIFKYNPGQSEDLFDQLLSAQ